MKNDVISVKPCDFSGILGGKFRFFLTLADVITIIEYVAVYAVQLEDCGAANFDKGVPVL